MNVTTLTDKHTVNCACLCLCVNKYVQVRVIKERKKKLIYRDLSSAHLLNYVGAHECLCLTLLAYILVALRVSCFKIIIPDLGKPQ